MHVLAGQTLPVSAPRYDAYFASMFADRIRNESGVATFVSMTSNSSDEINGALAAGRSDFCLLSSAAS